MWILTFVPTWLFHLTFFLSIVVYLIATTLKILPYSTVFKYGSIATLFFSVYMIGIQTANNTWLDRTKKLELQVKELEVKSAQENVKIIEKVVVKKQIISEKGKDIIQYVDKVVVKDNEVIKYIEHCPKIPVEVVNTINKAATP